MHIFFNLGGRWSLVSIHWIPTYSATPPTNCIFGTNQEKDLNNKRLREVAHIRNRAFDVGARYKEVLSSLKGQEFFHEDWLRNLISVLLTSIPHQSCSRFTSMPSISSSDFPFGTHSTSWVLQWSGGMMPLVWCSEPYFAAILASSTESLVATYCSVKDTWELFPQWSLGGGNSSMSCPPWAARDSEIHQSSLLGLAL